MNKRLFLPGAILCLTIAAACSSEDGKTTEGDPTVSVADISNTEAQANHQEPSPDMQSGADQDPSPEGGPAAGSGAATSSDVFDEVLQILDQLLTADQHALAECMHTSGFPHNAELLADSVAYFPSQSLGRLDLTIYPHELGPYTEAQAREFGLAGSIHIGSSARRQPGTIRSNDPAYFSAYEACAETERSIANPALEAKVQSAYQTLTEMNYEIQSAFRKRARPVINQLLDERRECVGESGHANIGVDATSGDSWSEFLEKYGVKPGRTEYANQAGNQVAGLHDPLEPGETKVVLSSEMPAPKYYPSAEEIELALTFVRCMEEIDFLRRLEELQVPVRTEVLADYETEILGLREQLDAIVDQ